jgi:hypothetical protein
MKEIRCEQLMDVSAWKRMREWLSNTLSDNGIKIRAITYHNVVSNTEIIPENIWVERLDKNVCFLMRASMTLCVVKVGSWRIASDISVSDTKYKIDHATYFGHQFDTTPVSQTCSG